MRRLAYIGYLALQTKDARFRKKLARNGYVGDVLNALKEPDIPSSVRMEGKKSARPRSSPEDACVTRQDGEGEKKSVSDIGWVDEIMEEEESLPTPKESLPDKRSKNDEKQNVKPRLSSLFPGF